ncbi:hypothetical protein QTP88_026907 [Uroleucon formosanum]
MKKPICIAKPYEWIDTSSISNINLKSQCKTAINQPTQPMRRWLCPFGLRSTGGSDEWPLAFIPHYICIVCSTLNAKHLRLAENYSLNESTANIVRENSICWLINTTHLYTAGHSDDCITHDWP